MCIRDRFEAGREKVGKNGVVRDPATHREVLHNAMGYAAAKDVYKRQVQNMTNVTVSRVNLVIAGLAETTAAEQ